MSKYEPSEDDLGFNPYVFDDETFEKINTTHYSPENVDHRKRLLKWKERDNERKALAKRLGIEYSPKLTPTKEVLNKIFPKDL